MTSQSILEALYIIFIIRPYHHNVARAILKEPKVYFFDTGYLPDDAGMRWENATAAMLLKHAQYEQDLLGRQTTVHYLRTKDGAEVDFVICNDNTPTHLIECKYADNKLSPALIKFASQFSEAEAVQLVRELRQEEYRCKISIARGAEWLAALSA